MIDLRGFRKANNLTQEELGEFLDMKKSFISKVENGKEKLPEAKFQKLIANERGWNIDALLTELPTHFGDNIQVNGGRGNIGKSIGDAAELLALRRENELLRTQVDDLKAQNEKYWAALMDLMKRDTNH